MTDFLAHAALAGDPDGDIPDSDLPEASGAGAGDLHPVPGVATGHACLDRRAGREGEPVRDPLLLLSVAGGQRTCYNPLRGPDRCAGDTR